MDPRIPIALDLAALASPLPPAVDWYLDHAVRAPHRAGGWIDRTLLRAPDRFGSERTPLLERARYAALALDPGALAGDPGDLELESAVSLARRRLQRRIEPDASLPTPLLIWGGDGLWVCVPTEIPGASDSAAACVWLSHSDEIAFARARRVDPLGDRSPSEATAWFERAAARGVRTSVWSLPLPSHCETSVPIAIEIAPNPTGFMHAMYIAHAGAAVIVAGYAEGVGGTRRAEDEPPRPAWLVPSGWSYLKPDRTQGSSAPYFPNGARAPSDAAFVPDEALFLECARSTWPASLRDALRVALAG